eukprot:TRINITY_DN156_c1_g4_i1.p1 TRINITY_DN156_c1_g4~~TRINITY_DN156_c1_g4_i1.p1  ORF type:complete len:377 (-),score=179.37 TRINITY_DN156_c1_g4_i1:85-1173(-)
MFGLNNIKVIELAGLAPVPFCGMLLSDFGAQVTVIDRPQPISNNNDNDDNDNNDNNDKPISDLHTINRNKKFIYLDLKNNEENKQSFLELIKNSDILLDPFRPGVLERLNFDPIKLLTLNPKLIIARLSGYGQTGPLALTAGHDLNYLAISGILSLFRRNNDRPFFPINLLADFAGGGLLCAFGILVALFEREKTGKGKIIDCSMTEGVSYLASFIYHAQYMLPSMVLGGTVGSNMLDGGDGKFIAVGAIESQFYENFLKGIGLFEIYERGELAHQMDTTEWINLYDKFSKIIESKTRDEWVNIFENLEACVTPVLELNEVSNFKQHKFRNSFTNFANSKILMPSPAPKLININENQIKSKL